MYTFILLSIIAIICFIVSYLVVRYANSYTFDWVAYTFLSIGIFTIISIIITACTLINIDTRFEAAQNKYEVITQMIDSYNGQDYGNMTTLTEAVVMMNDEIAVHKAHYKSNWTGLWYSEDIANLQPIVFSKKVSASE